MRIAFVLVAACGASSSQVGHFEDDHGRERARDAVVAAANDVSKMEALLGGDVVDGGLWFLDGKCATMFSSAGQVPHERVHDFATCLVGLHLQASARRDAFGDVVVLTYPPGFELETRVVYEIRGPHLTWIGYESRRDDADALPTISATTLETLRTSGDRNGPIDPAVAATLELDQATGTHVAFSWLKVCIDNTGAVSDVHVHETTSAKASTAFAAAARTWMFKPFMVEDQPMPVCADVRACFPANQSPAIETVPFPPPPMRSKREPLVLAEGPKSIEGHRIRGSKFITPDDDTKTEIQEHHGRATGSFRVCVDETGHVESVLPLYSTGYAAYDHKLITGMQAWGYSPYIVDGQAVPVCTTITFIYSQR